MQAEHISVRKARRCGFMEGRLVLPYLSRAPNTNRSPLVLFSYLSKDG
jgi:hypothetical protein